MKNIYIIPILFLTIFSSCTNTKNQFFNADLNIEIDFNKTVSIHNIGLIDEIEILRLDNKELFGRADKVIKSDNHLYLLDAFKTNSVFIYDMTGVLLKQISNIGQGPKEYLQLTDIFVDKNENELGLVSRADQKLFKYDLMDFSLKSIEKLPKPFFYFINSYDGYIGYMNNLIEGKPFNLWTMSKSLKLEESLFEIPFSWDSKAYGSVSTFSTFEDKVYYIQPRDFNIYCIEKNDKRVAYRFDLGKNTWPSNIITYNEVEKLSENSPGKYIEKFNLFQETANHLITRVVFKGQDLLGVYDKRVEKSYAVTFDPYTDKYFIPFGRIVGMDENAIYTLVDADRVNKNIIGKDEYNDFESVYPEQIKNLREKFKGVTIDESDNPFLLIHYFNKK